jgi:Ca2+/Na+ antiporter
MTTAAIALSISPSSQPTLAVAAGRNLMAAGAVFGAANLFQFGVVSGALGLHPAVLSLSWPLAVALFLAALFRLRRSGGEAARRAGQWSRYAVLTQIAAALALLGLSFATKDWGWMRATSVVGMSLYASVWGIAAVRTGRLWMALVAGGCLVTAAGLALLLGSPAQYLAYSVGLFTFILTPGLVLASGRIR